MISINPYDVGINVNEQDYKDKIKSLEERVDRQRKRITKLEKGRDKVREELWLKAEEYRVLAADRALAISKLTKALYEANHR